MKKRAAIVFMIIFVAILGISIRIADIMLAKAPVSGVSTGKRIDISTLRGTVYDCNTEPLTNNGYELWSAVKPTVRALEKLKTELDEETVSSLRKRMEKASPIIIKTVDGIYDCPDIATVSLPQRYAESSLACHIIGYLDSSGEGISGIEKIYNTVLSKDRKSVYARFSTDANGRVLLGESIEFSDYTAPKSGVILTLDKNIQMITENALDESGAECAAAVVIEVESGAIRACVSRPLFNRENLAESLNDEKSPLINRAFMPFSVGSVFKPVVAAAALESGIEETFEYNCTGSVELNGVTFNCHKNEGHGVLNMKGAVSDSCNTYFISLAQKIGAERVIDTASLFGFGKETALDDNISSYAGNLPSADEIDSKAMLANLSFGQGALTATPIQICSMVASIANGGVYCQPYLVEGMVDDERNVTAIRHYSERKQIISESAANKLKLFLLSVVEEGSGRRAKSNFVSVAGKTATAQTGKFKNNEEIYNAWFAGFFPFENPKYAVVIMKEDGGEGAISCAPVFRKIAEEIAENE